MMRGLAAVLGVAAVLAAGPAARADEVVEAFATGFAAFQAKDYDAAIAVWRPMAEAGNARAQLGLAVALWEKHGKDFAVAAEVESWLLKAARSGHPTAQWKLGELYKWFAFFPKSGAPRDKIDEYKAQAIYWYRQGALQGDTIAIYGLLTIIQWGEKPEAYFWALIYAKLKGQCKDMHNCPMDPRLLAMTEDKKWEVEERAQAWQRQTP